MRTPTISGSIPNAAAMAEALMNAYGARAAYLVSRGASTTTKEGYLLTGRLQAATELVAIAWGIGNHDAARAAAAAHEANDLTYRTSGLLDRLDDAAGEEALALGTH